jgi:hypothetical protein
MVWELVTPSLELAPVSGLMPRTETAPPELVPLEPPVGGGVVTPPVEGEPVGRAPAVGAVGFEVGALGAGAAGAVGAAADGEA